MNIFAKSAAALLAIGMASVPAQAYTLIIVNNTDQQVANVSAKPGKVESFKRINPGSTGKFELTMPKGQCVAALVAVLPDGQSFRHEADVCGGFRWTFYN